MNDVFGFDAVPRIGRDLSVNDYSQAISIQLKAALLAASRSAKCWNRSIASEQGPIDSHHGYSLWIEHRERTPCLKSPNAIGK
jgi:hypothetical protein